jgi:hypothetical protein
VVLSLIKTLFSLRNSEEIGSILSVLYTFRCLTKEVKSFIQVLNLNAAKNANLSVLEGVYPGV